ncbi:MAG: leucine-rich repeat domain-containing protein [Ruminococcus sp.]|nr:leucine-rich repeat domain-containing protein [Ruminococcus sp.]
MPFVEAKCQNCGGILSLDSTKNIWICSYCHTPYIFEKTGKESNIADGMIADMVKDSDVTETDFLIKDGKLQVYRGISRDVIIPDNVGEICTSAFAYSTHLQTVVIPESVRKMEGAFSSCTALRTVEIRNGIKSIGNAFANCTALEAVTIPESVKYIDENDFKGCNNLVEIDYPYLKEFEDCFPALLERKRTERKNNGLCIYCGGKFSIFGTCKVCGKKKDYK